MNILDENIADSQRLRLRSWRIHVRQIGFDIAQKGIQDDAIIPFLLRRRRSTFFTHDSDFYDRSLCHSRYCLVVLQVSPAMMALFIRRFLRHPVFDSEAKRMGRVVRLSPTGITVWRGRAAVEEHIGWHM